MKELNFFLVAIAGGLGSFEPRKPLIIDGINFYENKGIKYLSKIQKSSEIKEW
jgi:thioredoxin reductase (NADPH)